ncbi:MAG: PilZ domain-containing protein [Desulfobacteraceae bacterium]|nr:PilZ domain-containing protein [Desulfobacteraceae bacterium]
MGNRNRRQHRRVTFQTAIDLGLAGRRFENCQTRDLSLRGVFVVGADGQEGEEGEVVLHLTGASSDLALKMKGKVVRVEARGIALRFSEIDLDSFTHLKNIIYYNTEDPDVLQEEWLDPASGA